MEFRIHHVALSVSDIAVSKEWYKKMFGFEEEQSFETLEGKVEAVYLVSGSVRLELLEHKNSRGFPNYRSKLATDLQVIGAKHFAFEVNDIDEAYEELISKGVEFEITPVMGGSGRKVAFFRDPDGIIIELCEVKN